MSISFKLKESYSPFDTPHLYFEVKSDSLVVARVNVDDWRDRRELSDALYKAHEELDEWGVES